MQVTNLSVRIHRAKPNPNPVRDALQTLPAAGNVEVALETDNGIRGSGD